MNSSLKLRTVSGIVFVLVMLGCLLFSPYLYAALIVYMMAGMMHEFYTMTMGDLFKLPRFLAIASGIIFFGLLFCFFSYSIPPKLIALGMIPITATMVSLLFDKDRKGHLRDFSHIFTGLVYIAVPLSLSTFIALKDGSFSCILLICFFVIIWCSDIGAYTAGMAFGQKADSKKLCPDISPKKTWIGFWGGLAFSIIAAIVLKLTGLLDIHRDNADILTLGADGDVLQVHQYLNDILTHTRNGTKLMQHPIDPDRRDSGASNRGEQDPAQCIAQGHPVAPLQGLHGQPSVSWGVLLKPQRRP